MAPPLVFSVHRRSPILVTPAEPTPRHLKLLSDIDDHDGFRFHIPVILFYPPCSHPSGSGPEPVAVIRDALSKVLVPYYPFAGRLRELENRKLAVDCTGEGVLYTEAEADVRLDQFGTIPQLPIPCWEELIFDVEGSSGITNCPLLLIQVTRLVCGGFTFGIRLNHAMSDATGLAQFVTAVAELARGAARPTVAPVWRRDLLNARRPPHITCRHLEYEKVRIQSGKNITLAEAPVLDEDLVYRSFFFGPKEVAALKEQLPCHLRKSCSRFEIIMAHLWRCRTVALQFNPDEELRFMCVVNARKRMSPPLPEGYYGNAIAFAAVVTTAAELIGKPLGYAVEIVARSKSAVTDEYMRSLSDYLVTAGRPMFVMEPNCYMVTDETRAGFSRVDFGWGSPVYGGSPRGTPVASFFLPSKNPDGVDARVVTVCLPRLAMERFELEMKKLEGGESCSGGCKADQANPKTALSVIHSSNL